MITIDFNQLDIHPNDKILDIGCGEGRHTLKAGQHNDTLCVGADFDLKNLIETKKK